jgi:RimJ/RimL family protein N-acetyltransferase
MALRCCDLRFDPLGEQDLPLLFAWLQQPHVREFYQRETPVWDEIRAQHLRTLAAGSPTRRFVISTDHPIGYIQAWRIADSPAYTAPWGVSGGISLDLLIGEPDAIGRGWGRLILIRFLHEVAFPLFPEEDLCWILHDCRNQRAMRASVAAGFRYSHDVMVHGFRHALLQLTKVEAANMAAANAP